MQSKVIDPKDFNQEWFQKRSLELRFTEPYKRKHWEHAIICQVIKEKFQERLLSPLRAIGFGIGQERITAWLNYHMDFDKIYVSDNNDPRGLWKGQNCLSKNQIPRLYTSQELHNVSFEIVNMNDIPNLYKFGRCDLVWSSGSLEHIGGKKAGFDFIFESMKCLREGGIAVHTTEWDINGEGIDFPDICAYTTMDFYYLQNRLVSKAYEVFPIKFYDGEIPLKLVAFVDNKPVTSVLLIIKK